MECSCPATYLLTCMGFVGCARALGCPQDQAQPQGEGETVQLHN